MRPSRKSTASGVFALAAATLLAFPGAAFATDGSATIVGGSLTWGLPADVSFGGVVTGHAQVLATNQGLDISDQTMSGDGWNITLTTTTFTTGGANPQLLDAAATTDISSTGACDTSGEDDCVMAQDSTTPIAIPAGSSAPAAVLIQSAEVDSGMGVMTYTHVMNLAIPATARAGVYHSTWTYSLATGP